MNEPRRQLKADLLCLIQSPAASEAFDELALRLWRWQQESMPDYRSFCEGRGARTGQVARWSDIPLLPVEAFKFAEIACPPAAGSLVRRFSTSGTSTRGLTRRPGVSLFDPDALEVMNAAVVENARRYLFPDGQPCRIVALAPPPAVAPEVIMVHGLGQIAERFGAPGSAFYGGPAGLDFDGIVAALRESAHAGVPVALLGASFAFVHLLDGLVERRLALPPLPPGSRAMDAGGYKGRSRELSAAEFRASLGSSLGLPDDHIVNLLGMTELASQVYDDTLAGQGPSRIKRPPPWMRCQVLVAEEGLRPARPGEIGLLAHWDLANFTRPLALLSDDLARAHRDGFEILGRARRSEQRGCSLRVADREREVA